VRRPERAFPRADSAGRGRYSSFGRFFPKSQATSTPSP